MKNFSILFLLSCFFIHSGFPQEIKKKDIELAQLSFSTSINKLTKISDPKPKRNSDQKSVYDIKDYTLKHELSEIEFQGLALFDGILQKEDFLESSDTLLFKYLKDLTFLLETASEDSLESYIPLVHEDIMLKSFSSNWGEKVVIKKPVKVRFRVIKDSESLLGYTVFGNYQWSLPTEQPRFRAGGLTDGAEVFLLPGKYKFSARKGNSVIPGSTIQVNEGNSEEIIDLNYYP